MANEMFKLALKIQSLFDKFYLAGGTAIMFKHDHRKSLDLDFFSLGEFSYNGVAKKIRRHFKVKDEQKFPENIDFFVENIKVSFVFFPFRNIKKLEVIKGLKIASDYDIFLNKIYSAGRRIEPKDPYDAAFLYRKHSWNIKKIRADFQKKFPDQSFEIYLGALASFDDYGDLEGWVKKIILGLISK